MTRRVLGQLGLDMGSFVLILALLLGFADVARAQLTPPASKPFFLVAKPDLIDPFFSRSVILMLPYKQSDLLVVGLIINKPTKFKLATLFPGDSMTKKSPDLAYFGGPVDVQTPSLVFRSVSDRDGAMKVLDDSYVSLDPKSIEQILKQSVPLENLRVYLGRSQWAPEQLTAEMLEGSWYVLAADRDDVFSTDPATLWHTLIGRAQLQPVAWPGSDCAGAPERSMLWGASWPLGPLRASDIDYCL